MPPKTLTDLAPELLIQIFKLSKNFTVATSLSRTSHKLFTVWQLNLEVICQAILPRTVRFYAQARELIDAQERVKGAERSVHGYQFSIDQAQRMWKGAETAADAFDYFQDCFLDSQPWGPEDNREMLTRAEERDFRKAYYRATTLATLGEESLPSRMLSSWNRLELNQVRDVMDWVVVFHDEDDIGQEIGVWFGHCSSPVPVGVTRGEVWERISGYLKNLNCDLEEFTSKPDRAPGRGLPLFYYTVRHRYQEKCESYKSTRLADLLPLVRQKGPRYNTGYRLSEE